MCAREGRPAAAATNHPIAIHQLPERERRASSSVASGRGIRDSRWQVAGGRWLITAARKTAHLSFRATEKMQPHATESTASSGRSTYRMAINVEQAASSRVMSATAAACCMPRAPATAAAAAPPPPPPPPAPAGAKAEPATPLLL